jgi:hypothetical protein
MVTFRVDMRSFLGLAVGRIIAGTVLVLATSGCGSILGPSCTTTGGGVTVVWHADCASLRTVSDTLDLNGESTWQDGSHPSGPSICTFSFRGFTGDISGSNGDFACVFLHHYPGASVSSS